MPIDAIEPFKTEFGVPAGYHPIGAISVGYSDEPPRDLRARRRPTGDVVFRGDRGQPASTGSLSLLARSSDVTQ